MGRAHKKENPFSLYPGWTAYGGSKSDADTVVSTSSLICLFYSFYLT